MSVKNQITVFFPGFTPQTFDLDAFGSDSVYMGRGPRHGNTSWRNDIQIDDIVRYVSRAQCVFERNQTGQWRIVDSQSHNGLIFHDQRVTVHNLSDGDKIYIGDDESKQFVMLYSRRPEVETEPYPDAADSVGITSENIVDSYDLREVDRFVIGRSPECDVVLDHPTVSRIHCIIERHGDSYIIADNGSMNGVILNSEPLRRPTELAQMDRISIAGFSFIFCDQFLYIYEVSGGVGIIASGLTKQVGRGDEKKTITNDVNLLIEPNKFYAIVGGSGAGKTTLLNCISGMTDFTSGEVLVNGESIRTSGKSLRSLMGYVPQQDIVHDSLTLERMLWYSARLRMPQDTAPEEIERKIDETLEIVELSDHRSTLISRLSGGERKRASIAVELLASPRLFFLDEPSSGLDPGTEKHLMQMLKRLSSLGKTVIMVTHTVQNLDLCDGVICMGRGGVLCFEGTPKEALEFFGVSNYTDIYDDLNDNSRATAERFASYAKEWQQGADAHGGTVGQTLRERKLAADYVKEFTVMCRRYMEIMASNLPRLVLLLLMPVFLTILVCIAFQADGNISNFFSSTFGVTITKANYPFLVASDTMSLMFAFSCAAFWVGIFNSIQEVSKERPIYERERFSGISVLPYVLSKFVPLCALCIVQSVLMYIVLRFMTDTVATVDGNVSAVTALSYGMPADGVILGSHMMWLETLITTFLCVLSAMCLGLMISTLVSNDMALVLCPICLMPQILFSGVVGELTGITKTISEFVTCRWSCLAFFVSSRINELYKSCAYKAGSWELTTFSDDDGIGILDAAYELDTPYLFGMDGVRSGWVVLTLMCVVCVVLAVVILRLKRDKVR